MSHIEKLLSTSNLAIANSSRVSIIQETETQQY